MRLGKDLTPTTMTTVFTLKSTARLHRGHQIPLLGLGVYQNYDARTSVLQALEAGYRHIDSAQAYRNEEAVGQAVAQSSVKREDIFITSKVKGANQGYQSTLKSVNESLERFGFDYIDLFLIHDPYPGKVKRLETYKALLEARDEGKIRTVGVSNYGIPHLKEILEAGFELPAVNQIQLHPFCQQREIVDYCQKNGIIVQAYSPLIQAQKGMFDHPTITTIATKHGKDNAQVLIRWTLQKGWVTLPKSANPERIVSNAAVYDFELDEKDVADLDSLDRGDEGSVSWHPVNAP